MRIAVDHRPGAFEANIPGRMIVDSSQLAAMSRSIPVWSAAIDPSRVGRQTLDHRRCSRLRGGPGEEDGIDTSQSRVERFGLGKVAGDDLDLRWRHRRRLGSPGEGPHRHVRVQ